MSGSSVAEFYRGRSILITGGTGFMGKVLVEKLLRSCPEVSQIYLLMRPKGSQDVGARLRDMLCSRLFDRIRSSSPDSLSKLVCVEGDIMQPGLGLSEGDTLVLSKAISVVFHAAATIKFDEALKLSLQMNVLGTKRLIELCHKMEKLVAMVHVSTAYCNCDKKEVKEIIYEPPSDPYKLLQLIDWMDDEVFNHLTPKLIGERPNTYTFTKALAEHVLVKEAGDLPITIVRPSIVCAAWKEPISGWVDNLNGATGLIVGAGKGMLRTLHCDPGLKADIIPVDIPINLLIVAAWYSATHRSKTVPVYNCVSGMEKPITWGEVNSFGMKSLLSNAMDDVVWYPSLTFTKHRYVNNVAVIFQHWIPAYVLDTVSRLMGKRPIMVRVAQKLARAAACLEYFTTHEWDFNNENALALWSSLSAADQHNFNFSLASMHWPTYMHHYIMGSKKYVMKEDIAALPRARKHLSKMWWLNQGLQVLFVLFAWRMVLLKSEAARNSWAALFRMFIRMISYLPIINTI